MTFLELQQYVARNVDDKQYAYFTPIDVKARLNLALKELQKKLISANQQYYDICVKTSTLASQNAYALPSDFMSVIRLERVISGSGNLINTQQIMPVSPNQINMQGVISGTPQAYYFEQNNIILVPTPISAIEIHLHYVPLVADMVADADIPNAPAQFHEYIGVLATRDCLFQDERSMAPIETKLKSYEELLEQIAVQRNADASRMVVEHGDSYGVY